MKSEIICLYTLCKKKIAIPKYIDIDDYEGEMICPKCGARLFVKFKGSIRPRKYRLIEKPLLTPSTMNIIVQNIAKRRISKRIVELGLRKDNLKKALGFYKNELIESYVPNKEYDQLMTDMGFRIPSIIVADAHSTGNAGTYYYEFAYKAPKIGAAIHVLDLFFVFGTLDTMDISDAMELFQSNEEKQLSELMMDAWTSFARGGNPNHPNLPNWSEYESDTRSTMILDIEPKLVSGHLVRRIDFWKSISLL